MAPGAEAVQLYMRAHIIISRLSVKQENEHKRTMHGHTLIHHQRDIQYHELNACVLVSFCSVYLCSLSVWVLISASSGCLWAVRLYLFISVSVLVAAYDGILMHHPNATQTHSNIEYGRAMEENKIYPVPVHQNII